MWFLVGILLVAALLFFALWLRSIKVLVKWYEWLIAVTGLALLLFGVQNYRATRAEHWSAGTPLTFLLVFGVPALILLALAAFMPLWRHFRSNKAKSIGDQ